MCNDQKLHECDCPCHTNPEMKHYMACCEECPNCHQRIKILCLADHKKNCRVAKSSNNYEEGYPPHAPVMDVDDLDLAP